jgi:hypothetical protein
MSNLTKNTLKKLLLAGIVSIGAGAGYSFAEEHVVNNVWWGLIYNYNGSSQTACVAKNYNINPVKTVFDFFPARFDFEGNPAPGRAHIFMRPYVEYLIYIWPKGFSVTPHCNLRSYSLRVS